MGLFDFLGGKPSKTTTQVKYSPEQQKLIGAAMPGLTGAISSPPQLPDIGTVQPFNPLQLQAQQQAITAAMGPLSQYTGNVLNASNFLMGDALRPETNPYLRATAEAAIRPVTETLMGKWLPGVRSGAMEAGGLGGSRQHGLENRAIGQAAQIATDATSKIYSDAFQSGMGNLIKNIALAPQTGSMALAPASVIEGVGGQQYQLATAQAQEAYNRALQEQWMPYLLSKDVAGTAMGLGSGTTTTSTGATPGMLGGALGGGAIAGSLAKTIPFFGGPIGLGAGAGLGALSALFG
jgi:hypothetical protein